VHINTAAEAEEEVPFHPPTQGVKLRVMHIANLLSSIAVMLALGCLCIAEESMEVCACSQITACKDKFVNSLFPCLDDCKSHAAAIRAEFGAFKQCLQAQEGKFKAALGCMERSYQGFCAREAQSRGQKVPKRDLESLRLASFAEVGKMARKMGVEGEVRAVLHQGKKFYLCVMGCMDRRSDKCIKSFKCSLQLPGDQELVREGKRCAINNGFNTAGLKAMCECVAKSGVK